MRTDEFFLCFVMLMKDWNGEDSLLSVLPNTVCFQSRGSIDRYGFSSILASRCNLRRTRKCFAEWVHGWIWDESPTIETLAVNKLDKRLKIVVAVEQHKVILQRSGFSEVFVGGLPFAYVGSQNVSRYKNSLLAMPVHSAEDSVLNSYSSQYLDYLKSIKNDFSCVYVCLHKMDWNSRRLFEIERRGLRPIVGADPNDANSLFRIRRLLESFETVTSNSIGSHFLYALYAGCKFSFSGPFYERETKEVVAYARRYGLSDGFIDAKISSHSLSYVRKRFSDYFSETPLGAVSGGSWVGSAIGVDKILPPEDIVRILGWSSVGSVLGYFSAAVRRVWK